MAGHGHDSSARVSAGLRWILVGLIAATLVFGCWGFCLYYRPDSLDEFLSIAYHDTQLLLGHGIHLDGKANWQLHLGRFLGVLSLFVAGLVAFTKLFRQDWLNFRLHLPWRRRHVVICGLGDLGLRLALDGCRQKRFMVAVEKDGEPTAMNRAREEGILVIDGDACDASTLRRASLERAEFVVACCERDETNVAIAATVGRLLAMSKARSRPLVCRLLVRDPGVRRSLEEQLLALPGNNSQGNYHVNFRDLVLEEVAARQALQNYPLDFLPIDEHGSTIVHLVIIGFGNMSRSLALQAARVGIFANNAENEDRVIRITVVDQNARERVESFRHEYPKFDKVCRFTFIEAERTEAAVLEAVARYHSEQVGAADLVTYATCVEKESPAGAAGPDDCTNLCLGAAIGRGFSPDRVQVLMYQGTRSGFAALYAGDSFPRNGRARLFCFGMIEDVFTWDTLLHERQDQLAQAFHEDFVRNRLKEGKSEPSWEELADGLQDSNRHAADHVPTKLRALGLHLEPIDGRGRGLADAPASAARVGRHAITEFSAEQTLLLSKMEHRRWCVERWLAGWEYGPESIRAKKISRDLVPWDKIPEEELGKDPEQIAAVLTILRQLGWAVYKD